MKLSELRPAAGSNTKNKRVGRGQGSGRGGTSTRGHKGGQSRSGYSAKEGFEGGQMPLQRRVPKFGFKSPFRVEYKVVNLDQLERVATELGITEFTPEVLREAGLLSSLKHPVKVLGRGELKTRLAVSANHFSGTAKAAIEGLGGTTTLLHHPSIRRKGTSEEETAAPEQAAE